MKTKIYSIFDPSPKVLEVNDDPTMTQQHFAAECDINNIIASYALTGNLTDPLVVPTRAAQYGDFSHIMDYPSALSALMDAQERFDLLPAKLRARFENNPAYLLSFLENPDNRQEAIDLGILNAPVPISSAPEQLPT